MMIVFVLKSMIIQNIITNEIRRLSWSVVLSQNYILRGIIPWLDMSVRGVPALRNQRCCETMANRTGRWSNNGSLFGQITG